MTDTEINDVSAETEARHRRRKRIRQRIYRRRKNEGEGRKRQDEEEVARILADYKPEKAFCEEMRIKPRTARDWRQRRIGPPWLKVFNTIYYSVPGGRKWLKEQEQQPLPRKAGA